MLFKMVPGKGYMDTCGVPRGVPGAQRILSEQTVQQHLVMRTLRLLDRSGDPVS